MLTRKLLTSANFVNELSVAYSGLCTIHIPREYNTLIYPRWGRWQVSLAPMPQKRIEKHTLSRVIKLSKTGPHKNTPFHYVLINSNFFKTVKNLRYSSIMVLCLYFTLNHSVYSDLRKPTLFPLKCHFSDPKRWQRCALPSLKKSTVSHRFCLFKHRYQVDQQAPRAIYWCRMLYEY